jgi:hypothetical protein
VIDPTMSPVVPPFVDSTLLGEPDPPSEPPPNPTRVAIIAECRALEAMLLAKNAASGNSAIDPVRVFSKASPEEQIRVRLDDKLSRLARGQDAGEDTMLDLCGYIILLRVLRRVGGQTP